jgi:hypothetical protein
MVPQIYSMGIFRGLLKNFQQDSSVPVSAMMLKAHSYLLLLIFLYTRNKVLKLGWYSFEFLKVYVTSYVLLTNDNFHH